MAELHPVDVTSEAVRLAGVLHLEPSIHGRGYALHRLPAWTKPQVVDMAFLLIRGMPSGCRVEMVTDATTIELDVALTLVQIGGELTGAGFDLVVDGELVDGLVSDEGTVVVVDMETGAVSVEPGEPTTVRFDLPPGAKRVEVWLPNAASVDLLELRIDGTSSAPPLDRPRWVHYGSSISHCLEAKRPTGVWPAVAARLAGVDLQSLGFAGQCQLDGFAARTIRDLPADVISCKLGINVVNGDTMRERTFVPAVHNLIDTIREGHPDTPLLIVTPIYCPTHEDEPGPSLFRGGVSTSAPRPAELAEGALDLQRIRRLHGEIVAARRAAGDEHLHLLDGLELFGPDDVGDLPDLLHPNAAGYQRMGERFHRLAFGPGGVFGGSLAAAAG
jgi:lysophospholipase L1-like esterase